MHSLNKKTKIVCTIGPSSWDPVVLKKMVQNGMNVARVNGAFADLDELERVEKLIRGVSDKVALMLDIKGHEVRLNKFENPIQIKVGDILEIGPNSEYEVYPITYPDLYKELKVGDILIFDDGNVEGVVRQIGQNGSIKCEITYGSQLKPAKSINTPGIKLSNPALTQRDKDQISFCKKRNWEFLAASFIRGAEDASMVMKQLSGSRMRMIAKIEDGQGINNVDEILDIVDGIMVARGDLGVEIPFERIPIVQKEIIWKCNVAGKPVITATQMLESMTHNPRPTRAEITDVANAIIDGTDAVMLSGESSSGLYPAEAVKVMTRIANEVESNIAPEIIFESTKGPAITDALVKAAFQVAYDLQDEIKAIIVVSQSGRTARLLGRFHLSQPVYAFVSEDIYRRQLALCRGVTASFTFPKVHTDHEDALQDIMKQVIDLKIANRRDKVLLIGKSPLKDKYFPNIFEVVEVGKGL